MRQKERKAGTVPCACGIEEPGSRSMLLAPAPFLRRSGVARLQRGRPGLALAQVPSAGTPSRRLVHKDITLGPACAKAARFVPVKLSLAGVYIRTQKCAWPCIFFASGVRYRMKRGPPGLPHTPYSPLTIIKPGYGHTARGSGITHRGLRTESDGMHSTVPASFR